MTTPNRVGTSSSPDRGEWGTIPVSNNTLRKCTIPNNPILGIPKNQRTPEFPSRTKLLRFCISLVGNSRGCLGMSHLLRGVRNCGNSQIRNLCELCCRVFGDLSIADRVAEMLKNPSVNAEFPKQPRFFGISKTPKGIAKIQNKLSEYSKCKNTSRIPNIYETLKISETVSRTGHSL